jgi:hypothetical protein
VYASEQTPPPGEEKMLAPSPGRVADDVMGGIGRLL